jgi:hypothetical protein
MLRGLPAELTLSAGFRLKDSWAVSLRDLANLALISPPDYEGNFEVEVLLIKGRNTPADSRVITVEILPMDAGNPNAIAAAPRRQEAPAPQILTAAPPEPVEPPQQLRAAPERPSLAARPSMEISSEMEASMIDRASDMLANGDVAGARLLLEHVARKGSGKAAMALGRTFDPRFFRSIDTVGLRPDAAKAKEWYGKAAELGEEDARKMLGALR